MRGLCYCCWVQWGVAFGPSDRGDREATVRCAHVRPRVLGNVTLTSQRPTAGRVCWPAVAFSEGALSLYLSRFVLGQVWLILWETERERSIFVFSGTVSL